VSPGDASAPEFTLSASAVVIQQLRDFYYRAEAVGQGDLVADAIRELRDRLTRSPNEFGEPKNRLSHNLIVRVGFVPPLSATIAVSNTLRIVFLTQASILSRYHF
jgi:hypothetical protein